MYTNNSKAVAIGTRHSTIMTYLSFIAAAWVSNSCCITHMCRHSLNNILCMCAS